MWHIDIGELLCCICILTCIRYSPIFTMSASRLTLANREKFIQGVNAEYFIFVWLEIFIFPISWKKTFHTHTHKQTYTESETEKAKMANVCCQLLSFISAIEFQWMFVAATATIAAIMTKTTTNIFFFPYESPPHIFHSLFSLTFLLHCLSLFVIAKSLH